MKTILVTGCSHSAGVECSDKLIFDNYEQYLSDCKVLTEHEIHKIKLKHQLKFLLEKFNNKKLKTYMATDISKAGDIASKFFKMLDKTYSWPTELQQNLTDYQIINLAEGGNSFKLNVKNITVDREKAVDGFKSAIFEYLINGKTQFGPEKKFKFYDIYNTLFEKKMSTTQFNPRTGAEVLKKETLANYLLRKGIFTESDVKTAGNALEELIGLEASDPANLFDATFDEAKPIMDFAVSIGGSAVGTRSQALLTGDATGPGSIIAAGRGAQLARDLFLRMPQITKKIFLADLLQNPQLLAKMLREYGDGKQSKGVFNAVKSYLIKNGYVDVQEE